MLNYIYINKLILFNNITIKFNQKYNIIKYKNNILLYIYINIIKF